MAIYDFKPTDILFNTIKTHPSNEFFTVSGNIFYQNQNAISGANVAMFMAFQPDLLAYIRQTLTVQRQPPDAQSVLMLLLTQALSILS